MATPTSPPCWAGKLWREGKVELELGLPRSLQASWGTDILDLDDRDKHDKIIERDDNFLVRFRVELRGRLWKAMTGSWCFDLGFTPIGKGTGFDLSEKLPNPARLCRNNWSGCETQCVQVQVNVPARLIPAERPSTVYEVAAKVALNSCGELLLAGMEPLEEYQFTHGGKV